MAELNIEKSNAKILVVDDSNTNILLLTSLLETEGFMNVQVANNGKTALKLIDKEIYDLILLDINMPYQIDGFDVLKIIKSDQRTSDTTVILVSANTSDDDIKLGMDLGAYEYLTKPVNINKLIKILNKLFK